MFLDVYIGDLEGFDFNDDSEWRIGHIPDRITPLFPYPEPFGRIFWGVKEGTLRGKQTDWGAWVAIMKRDEIIAFMEDHYGGRIIKIFEGEEQLRNPHMIEVVRRHQSALDDIYRIVEGLDPDKEYGVVASET